MVACRQLTRQLLEALAYLRREGVIHRDLKPENILVDVSDAQRPLLKLCDFGASIRIGAHRTAL